jgi:hypothetical protein
MIHAVDDGSFAGAGIPNHHDLEAKLVGHERDSQKDGVSDAVNRCPVIHKSEYL